MHISDIKWYKDSDPLQRPISYSELTQTDTGGVLLEGRMMSLEVDRRIIKYEASYDPLVNELYFPETKTVTFEGEFKNVYLYLAPMDADVPHLKPFTKRGINGNCYQLGAVGHQSCAGPKWIHAGGENVLIAPRNILLLFFKPPELTAQAASLAKAVIDAVKDGGPLKVTEEVFKNRKSICLNCEYYDPSAFMGTGRCRVCGCGVAKLQMPKQECPKGKWGKVN